MSDWFSVLYTFNQELKILMVPTQNIYTQGFDITSGFRIRSWPANVIHSGFVILYAIISIALIKFLLRMKWLQLVNFWDCSTGLASSKR